MKVLVVDGVGNLAPACIVFFTYWGHDVHLAHDGLEGLRYAKALRPDLLVATTELPRLDGWKLTAALGAGGAPGTAVVLAGPEDVHAVRKAAALGALDYVTTPVEVAHQLRAARKAETRPAAARQAG